MHPQSFLEALDTRVLVMDGGMGTMILSQEPDPEQDFQSRGPCCEILNVTRPDLIDSIHTSFLEAGVDAIETNTFRGHPLALADFDLGERAHELNLAAARIAREAADRYATPERPRYVLGAIGPGSRLPSLGHVDVRSLYEATRVQAEALLEGGVDAFMIETVQDPLQLQAALEACVAAREQHARDVPILVSLTVEVTGRMLVGTELGTALEQLANAPIDLIALNCATGPREMSEHVRFLRANTKQRIGVYPNAGLPQIVAGKPNYPLTPAELADWLVRYIDEDDVRLVGGCCGTTPAHLAAVVSAVKQHGARTPRTEALTEDEPPRVHSLERPLKGPALPRSFDYPTAPFLGARTIESIPLQSILGYVDQTRLFGFRWDYRRKTTPQKEFEAKLEAEAVPRLHELAKRCEAEGIIQAKATYGFFECSTQGNDVLLFDPADNHRELARFSFPRQDGRRNLCVADFFHARAEPDLLGLQLVTLGPALQPAIEAAYAAGNEGEHTQLIGLAVECTLAAAEYLHRQIRGELGIAADDARDLHELLKEGYRGARFTFGYPACPDEAGLATALDLLDAASIGVTRNDDGELRPTYSACALVCHHPAAGYFAL